MLEPSPDFSDSAGDGIALPGNRVVPAALLRFTAVRSTGPGGQNVNKTSTKVQLRVALDALAPILGAEVMERLQVLAKSNVTVAGDLVITCDTTRSQHMNKRACVERLTTLLSMSLRRPKRRKRTRPTRASKERRLDAKRRRSSAKRDRGAPDAHA